jgi:hypothetical protein
VRPVAVGQVALHADDVVRFLQPGTQLGIEIRGRRDAHVMSAPARTVVDRPDNACVREPAVQGEAGKKVTPARIQAGEADAGDGDEAGFLREYLHVAERFEERHVLARGAEDARRRTGEQCLQRESAA